MKETTSGIGSERVDELPILLACLQDLNVAEQLDQALPRPHGDRQGISYRQLSVILLAFVQVASGVTAKWLIPRTD